MQGSRSAPPAEAREPLTRAFGEATVKKLTLVEDDEGFVTLFCLILTPWSLEEAQRELNSFDESWWLAHAYEAYGKLNFDFELIRCRLTRRNSYLTIFPLPGYASLTA
jgi:hypothetical protein